MEMTKMVEWVKDNRLCLAGEKSKLMVLCTREMRAKKDQDDIFMEID